MEKGFKKKNFTEKLFLYEYNDVKERFTISFRAKFEVL